METRLRLGGVLFLFLAEDALEINAELLPFVDQTEKDPDITVIISRDWETVCLPATDMVGQDALLEFYIQDDRRFCVAKGGMKGPLGCTCYTPDFQKVVCTLNDGPFLFPIKKLGSILRMLPMREIFLYFRVLFFHAAQIAFEGKGILFTACSGVGKSTQAKLWRAYRGAEIVCNDRTLVREQRENWYTYGYPLDGSEPVGSNQVNDLGCVVVLEQGNNNKIERMRPGKAVSRLMELTVLDGWNYEAQTKALQLLAELFRDIPVYLLSCTPDEQAVKALEIKLREDGVISGGKSSRPIME